MITSVNIDNQKINVREVDEQNQFNVRGIFSNDIIYKIQPNFKEMSCSIKRNLTDDSFDITTTRPDPNTERIKELGGNDKAIGIFTSVNVDNKFFKDSFDYNHSNSYAPEIIHRSLFESHPLSSISTFPIAVNWMFDKDGESNADDEIISGVVISPQIFPIQDSFQITNDEAILFKMVKSFSLSFKENANSFNKIEQSDDETNSPFVVKKTYSYMLIKMTKPKQDEYTQEVAKIYIFNDDNSATNQDYLISEPKYSSAIFSKNSNNVHFEPSSENVTVSLDPDTTRRGKFLGRVLIDKIPDKVFLNKNLTDQNDQTIGEIIPYDFKNNSYMSELQINLNAILKKINLQNLTYVDKPFLDPMEGVVKLSVTRKEFSSINVPGMKVLYSDELKNISELFKSKIFVPLTSLESRSKNE